MSLAKFLAPLFKDGPVAGDVHISNAGGEEPKRKKKPKDTGAMAFETEANVAKVDEALGLVFGWAIVCKRNDEDYFDLQGDHIPEGSMLKASADFMASSQVAKEMHQGGPKGSVLFAFPMTAEIAKAFGVETKTTGLMIAMKPSSPEMLAKFKDGTYKGFSIGGFRIEDEDVD